MKEIGGYFGLEQLISKEYYPNLVALNSGRFALLYLMRAKKIRKLYIPYFLCDSVSGLCDRHGYLYEYYHITKDFLPDFNGKLKADEYIYIVNYYGQISNNQLMGLKEKYKNIIFDNVQAFYQQPISGVDTIYSCRKFFGVPDGAYLSTDVFLDGPIENDVSGGRMRHILGRFEGLASDYYCDFRQSDESYAMDELKKMSKLTHNILGAIDYEKARRQRNANYDVLSQQLDDRNQIKFKHSDGPYCYPFYCEDGMNIKKRLAQKNIYVATLWPNVFEFEECYFEKEYAENILPLPLDQRYEEADMQRIICEVLECLS